MKLKEMKAILAKIDDCDFLLRNTSNFHMGKRELPTWLQDDMTRSINNRKQNLIDQLRNTGLDMEV